MTRRILVLLAAALSLCACGTPRGPDRVVVQTVDRPVPMACVDPGFPAAPGPVPSAAQLRALPDGAARYQALQAFWLAAAPWIALAETTIADCRSAAPAPK
jgi:hypothetical protein